MFTLFSCYLAIWLFLFLFLVLGLVGSVHGLVAIPSQSRLPHWLQPTSHDLYFPPTYLQAFLPSFPKSYKRGHYTGVRFFIGLVLLFPFCLFLQSIGKAYDTSIDSWHVAFLFLIIFASFLRYLLLYLFTFILPYPSILKSSLTVVSRFYHIFLFNL